MLGWRSKPSPKWYNVMLAWVLQNIHRNEDRNCSSGLGKVEKGSGSRYVRHSRHSDHTGSDEPGGLPVTEAMHTRCEQDEMDGHPSSLCLFFFSARKKAVLSCSWVSIPHDVGIRTSACVPTQPHSTTATSAQMRTGRAVGMTCPQN